MISNVLCEQQKYVIKVMGQYSQSVRMINDICDIPAAEVPITSKISNSSEEATRISHSQFNLLTSDRKDYFVAVAYEFTKWRC